MMEFILNSILWPTLAFQVLTFTAEASVYRIPAETPAGKIARPQGDTLLPYESKDVSFPSDHNILIGRLFLPRGPSNFPVVIYVEGSDNGNTIASPYVRALARGFAKGSIGMFTYNKRGFSGSSGTPTEDFVERAKDVIAAYRFLSTFAFIDTVGLYGISQAGWVIPHVLSALKDIPFTILVSPAGVSPVEQVTYYLQNQWRKAGIAGQDIAYATEIHLKVALYYSTGSEQDYHTAQSVVERSRKYSWFALLNKVDYRAEVPDSGQLPTPQQLSAINKRDPDEYAFYRSRQNWLVDSTLYQSITSPVLVIYGGKDELVPVEQSMMIFQRSFSKNQNTDVTFRIYEAAGHDIQPVGSPYLTEGYREFMAEWIRHHIRARERR
jgi:pimeloyl-ACP methyl ester carboxylesterase